MKRFLLLFFIVFYLNSCFKEYDNFTPYVNDSIEYVKQFKAKTLTLTFSNEKKFEFLSESGFQLKIPANSFDNGVDKINVSMEYNTSLLNIIASGLQTRLVDGSIFSFDKTLNIKFHDSKNNEININEDSEILVKIPYPKNNQPKLLSFETGAWNKVDPETIEMHKSTWYTNDVDSILIKGYEVKLKKAGQIALAGALTSDDEINDVSVRLEDGFDVTNSYALLTIKNTHVNILLEWNTEEKLFKLPKNTILPSSDVVILVFSENSDKSIYFGMNYAKVIDGDIIDIKLETKKIEEIKELVNSISM